MMQKPEFVKLIDPKPKEKLTLITLRDARRSALIYFILGIIIGLIIK